MFKLLKFTAVASVLLASNLASAETCRVVKWHESKPLKIYAGLYKHVHVILPSSLSMNPVNANSLWDAQGKGQHLFISPTSDDKLGKKTTISALTDDGNSYDFIAEVNEDKFSACVRIVSKSVLSNAQLDALGQRSITSLANTQELQNKIKTMEKRYFALVKKAEEDKKEAVKQAVRKYRFHIYTRYQWKSSTGRRSFVDHNLLSDVYDDGRFTYLRLSNDNKSLPAIEAVVNGKPEFIEAKYDEVADLYRVVGIYPALSLKLNDDEIKVKRMDKATRGEF